MPQSYVAPLFPEAILAMRWAALTFTRQLTSMVYCWFSGCDAVFWGETSVVVVAYQFSSLLLSSTTSHGGSYPLVSLGVVPVCYMSHDQNSFHGEYIQYRDYIGAPLKGY